MIACERTEPGRVPHARAAEAAGGARARRGERRLESGVRRVLQCARWRCLLLAALMRRTLRLLACFWLLCPALTAGSAAACLAAAGGAAPPLPPLAGLADLEDGGDDSRRRETLRGQCRTRALLLKHAAAALVPAPAAAGVALVAYTRSERSVKTQGVLAEEEQTHQRS